MRFRLGTAPAALFGAFMVVALIVFLPLRLVVGMIGIGDAGFSAREVTGTVWSGGLKEARFGAIDLGDLGASLSPWPLLVGRARIDLSRPGAAAGAPLQGAFGISRHSFGLDDVTATFPAGSMFAPVPVAALDLDDASARFTDGVCERAEGRVRATLAGDLAGVPLGEALSGSVRCDGPALLLPLASQAGTESVQLRLWQTGRFTATLTIRAADAVAAQRLEAGGFSPGPGGESLSIEGQL